MNPLFQIVEGLIGLSLMVFSRSLEVFHIKYLVSCFVLFLIFIIIVIFSGCDLVHGIVIAYLVCTKRGRKCCCVTN